MAVARGRVGLGRGRRTIADLPAVEVAAGNDKFDTTNVRIIKPTSPGDSDVAVDNRVLSFPAAPGRLASVHDALAFICDASSHPCKPSDDFIVRRAVGLLRHG